MRVFTTIFMLAALWLGGLASAGAQAPAGGRLLVATPALDDPNFTESVVLLIEHGEQGSFGILINRPTWVDPDEVLPQIADYADYSGNLYRGGPMLPTTALMLLRSDELATRGARPLLGDIFVTTEVEILADLEQPAWHPGVLRLFAGHAAWEPGNLEREIANGYWTVVNGREDLIFTDDTAGLWQRLTVGDGVHAAPDAAQPAADFTL
jgi:putative transcriptional regulator